MFSSGRTIDDANSLHLTVRAEIAPIVGITACSAEKSNNGRCTPIDYRVTRG